MSVWQRDSSFTDFCNHEAMEFMYKFYPAKNIAIPTFHLIISRKTDEGFNMVYLSEIKIMENTDEYTRVQVPYTMQGDKGWIFYKQSYLEILYDHVSRSATFIPKERMNQMRSEDAINRERFTEPLDLRGILSHAAEHVILYYHKAFVSH